MSPTVSLITQSGECRRKIRQTSLCSCESTVWLRFVERTPYLLPWSRHQKQKQQANKSSSPVNQWNEL